MRSEPSIVVASGDIARFDGDAVVNAANNHLRMGAGVAGALARQGGPAIQRECDEYIERHGPLQVGQAAITGAGRLSVAYVIHAAAMGDAPAGARTIRASTRDALRLASEHALQRVAFPVLGTGVAGFPFESSARIMVEEIRKHAAVHACPAVSVLYGYTQAQADTLRALLTLPDPPNAVKR